MSEQVDLYSTLLCSASNNPDKVAIVELGRQFTYKELLLAVDRAADMFWELGIREDDKIALVHRNGLEFIVTHYALSKIGAITVPINFMISKAEEINYILSDCGAKGVVTQAAFAKTYAKLAAVNKNLRFILCTDKCDVPGVEDFWLRLKSSSFHYASHRRHIPKNDIISLIYTSGTTGYPKGAILTHNNVLSNSKACRQAFSVTPEDTFICILPMFHIFAWTTMVVLPISAGCKVLAISSITPATPWLNLMGMEGVTVIAGVPQIFGLLAKEARGLKRYYLQHWAFRKVRVCMSGAAPLKTQIVEHFEERLGLPLLEGYGLTETSPVVAVNRVDASRPHSVGLPLDGTKVKIVDDNNNELPLGVEGEICVKGPGVTTGYYGKPEATIEAFTPDGWFRTGDIGIVDEDGYVFIRDRKKDMIIIKGLKVFSAQVESVIQEHPGVAEAAVISFPVGEGEESIKCFCQPKPGAKLEKAEVMKFIRQKLDPYKRPREVEIVDALPRNSLNKVLKRQLRQQEMDKFKAKMAAKHAAKSTVSA